jgi:UPF0716 protein FxsA
MWLLLAFIAIPLIEIALFIQVGGMIGLWPTLLIVLLTAIAGTHLVRSQGAQAMNNLRGSFSRLDDPSKPLADGAMILLAGALLLTPGFFTDAVGFALLAPPIRHRIFDYLRTKVKVQHFQMGAGPMHQSSHHPQNSGPDIIDGDFTEVSPNKKPTHSPSGWTKH